MARPAMDTSSDVSTELRRTRSTAVHSIRDRELDAWRHGMDRAMLFASVRSWFSDPIQRRFSLLR